MTREEAIKWFRESPFWHKDHVPFNMAIQALEQELIVSENPNNCEMRDATPEERESIDKYIKSISKPTGIEFDIDIDKKVESYGKLLKHPVIKSIMGMDETQESCDVPDINDGKMSENPTDSKDVIWYSKRNYSEIVVETQERSEE